MRFDMYNFRNHKLHYDCAKLAFGLYARLSKFVEESSFFKTSSNSFMQRLK